MGYVMGKAEGRDNLYHGHVTAVTVAPECVARRRRRRRPPHPRLSHASPPPRPSFARRRRYRRLGLARQLMTHLEDTTERMYVSAPSACVRGSARPHPPVPRRYNARFVDLFVRSSNVLAIGMYERFGYTVYRRVLDYYAGEEDALDMRKALPRDGPDFPSVVPLPHPIMPDELEW